MTDTPRLAPLAAGERSKEQQQLLDVAGSELNIFTTLARNPSLFKEFLRFGGRLLNRSELPSDVRETLILRTAYRCRADYEWIHHVEIGRQVGLTDDLIAAIGTDDPAVDDETALLIRAADQLTTEHELDDQTWSALSERFDEQSMIELCMLVGDYAMIAGVLKSLRVPLEDGLPRPHWRS